MKKSACGSPNCACDKKTRLFGPGTWVTLAAVAVIATIGYMNSGSAPASTSHLPSATHPLWKPEPASLLSRSDLSAPQRTRIGAISAAWQAEKGKLEQAMAGFRPAQGRTEQISASLADFSDLSRAYDASRSQAWNQALNVLTASQKALVAEGAR